MLCRSPVLPCSSAAIRSEICAGATLCSQDSRCVGMAMIANCSDVILGVFFVCWCDVLPRSLPGLQLLSTNMQHAALQPSMALDSRWSYQMSLRMHRACDSCLEMARPCPSSRQIHSSCIDPESSLSRLSPCS